MTEKKYLYQRKERTTDKRRLGPREEGFISSLFPSGTFFLLLAPCASYFSSRQSIEPNRSERLSFSLCRPFSFIPFIPLFQCPSSFPDPNFGPLGNPPFFALNFTFRFGPLCSLHPSTLWCCFLDPLCPIQFWPSVPSKFFEPAELQVISCFSL